MKIHALILSLACAAAPLAALADDPSGPPPPSQSQRDAMQSYRTKSDALHEQARASMLNALTPANRSLLASLVSQAAVASQPDAAAAVQKLDAALSQGERQSILTADSNLRTSERTLRDQMRNQMTSSTPPNGAGHGNWQHGAPSDGTADAGAILMAMAVAPIGAMRPGMMGMGGPPFMPR